MVDSIYGRICASKLCKQKWLKKKKIMEIYENKIIHKRDTTKKMHLPTPMGKISEIKCSNLYRPWMKFTNCMMTFESLIWKVGLLKRSWIIQFLKILGCLFIEAVLYLLSGQWKILSPSRLSNISLAASWMGKIYKTTRYYLVHNFFNKKMFSSTFNSYRSKWKNILNFE